MLKNILSAIAGYATWTVVFLGGSAVIRSSFGEAHNADGGSSDGMVLTLYLLISVIASWLAGFVTARLADAPKMRWVYVLVVLLLGTGIPVQLMSWDILPVWYNLAFLALLIPIPILGGRKAGA